MLQMTSMSTFSVNLQLGHSSPAENDEREDVESRKAPDDDEHDEQESENSSEEVRKRVFDLS